ncbi:MAG: CYTH domain-containing protein [Sideroxydans sp.]|nr:CYTH domain-containing protein [Sideroxydans sp.]NOT97550.1 CYTH domain-containing protein [Sideroxydans sp.]
MALEIELKLKIAPAHIAKLQHHPWVRSIAMTRARTLDLYSVYYDTEHLLLFQHAMALRLRRVGSQWIQTLKGGGQMQAGLHQRNEWEAPVPSESLNFEILENSGGVLPHGARAHLKPIFVTAFKRNVRLVNYAGAEIELCIDYGEIRASGATHPIAELELELKSGSPQQLFELAQALGNIVPLTPELTNKAEYGYRLFSAHK